MKRFISLSLTLFCLSGIVENIQAQSFSEGSSDPVWGNNYRMYSLDVTSETQLVAAINVANDDKPHIIPIANDIQLTGAITITSSKYIVLRKSDNGTQKPWNYNNQWMNTNAATPDMYDDIADFRLFNKNADNPLLGSSNAGNTNTHEYRHFNLTGGTSTIILENITLDGQSNWSDADPDAANTSNTNSKAGGGISFAATNVHLTFAGNIVNCFYQTNSTGNNYVGAAIDAYAVQSVTSVNNLTLLGGVIGHNHGTDGAVFFHPQKFTSLITIRGYTILEGNMSEKEGGAIWAPLKIDIKENALFRRNTSMNSGGAIFQSGPTLDVSDNVTFTDNRAMPGKFINQSIVSGLGGAIHAWPAGGTAIVFNISGSAKFDGNYAARSGGAIAIGDVNHTASISLNINGSEFRNNIAGGEDRTLPVGANENMKKTIGTGGAIYAFDPKDISIPSTSDVSFTNNSAAFAAYIDNGKLQGGTTGVDFFNGDSYISHIQKPNIQTSLINQPGEAGKDYYNLYNNYDIGVSNDLISNLYSILTTTTFPGSGIGGMINPYPENSIFDILGDGRRWAEVGTSQGYTAVPTAGYMFDGWTVSSPVNPLQSEIATMLGCADDAAAITAVLANPDINIKVPSFEVNLVATFKKLANLVVTLPDFPVLALDATENNISDVDQANWPGDSIFTVSNDGDFDAHITGVSLVSGDISKFTLVGGGSTPDIAAGDTNKMTWTIRPEQNTITDTPTPGSPQVYTVTVRFAYTDDKTGTPKTTDVEVSFTVVKTSILFTGNYGFGTVTRGHANIEQTITLHNYGVVNGRLDTLFIARNFNPNTYTGSTDLAPFLDNSGVFQVGKNLSWGILADAEFDAVAKDDDNTEWSVRVLPNTTGIYQRQLVAIYSSADDPSLLFATATPLSVTLITSAVLTAQNIRFPDNREGYPIPPNTIPVNLINSGQTAADIKSATLQSGAGSNFNLTSGSNDHVPGVVGQVKGSNNNYGVTPKLGLIAGIYRDTVVFIYEDGTEADITLKVGVEFRVYPPVHTWIGGGGTGSGKANPDASDHAWSIPSNWKTGVLPAAVQFIEFDAKAIDLYVDGIYGAANITNTTSANLRILKDAALKLTDVVNGKTTALDFTGSGRIHVESGGETGANGALIVPKGSIANASFTFYTYGVGPDNATTTGEFSWQYFGIPVKQYQAILMEGGYIRKYVETNNNNDYWQWLTNSDVLEAASGYEITRKQYQGGYFTIFGELNTNDITLPNLTVTPSAGANTSFPGQHVVSNPYASGLSIRNALEFGENMYQSAYLFHTGKESDWETHKAVRGFAAGQYIAVPQQYAGEAYLPDTIASMQGFVVRVFADKPSGDAKNSLTFRYDNLTHGNTQLRAARVTGPKVYTVVSLSETDGELKDRFWLFSDRSTTLGYDNGYDGYKIFGEATLARLYAKPDGRSYQVSAQPTIDNTWLFMKAASGVTDYTLTFHHGNLEERYDNIYLYDAVTKTTTDVTEDGSTYRFTADNVLSNDQRFLLTTTQNTTFIDETTADVYFNIYGSNGITVENGYPSPARVQVYSLQGQLLYTTEISAQSRETLSANFTPGIYIVRAVVGGQTQTAKIMLKDRN